ncbi:MAG: acetyl-CoA carboxylase biotin carboxyl carrier protein subunit [Armatimonadota bacterium]|nr:acetyl-CoA carboxylase biotin carboxyl carrier protein subunit [Armatimonadota bacterium]MDR7493203.1 acetyl-CoA carboxylase biotin carboxyl carrier protein subunit [Armatimonadota bacterium]MDR7499444.1 acetyl-CoA carboxylase biotin carboxyl carrier protein subunit [Armatimonadota bacterium]MDR7504677.1 acetyl-CoA carboxylase biotin carboxyl carrier protein subunit [Armatimonadota bacterium]MDR7551436.1 acetyl-CoA carboxylase biotin carboxyl carrier protein subunit [Armatimonadota bacterium
MNRAVLALGAVAVIAVTAAAGPQSGWLDVKSTLAGTVLADDLVEVGARVEDGQPLVYVRTVLTGTKAVAARAPRNGTVREVLVRPGQRVRQGDVVVRIEPR